MEVGLGLSIDNAFSFIHGDGAPGASGGMPDESSPGSLYVNDTNGSLWRKVFTGSGVDKWSQIPALTTPNGVNNYNGLQVLDQYLVDDINFGKWLVEVSLTSDKSRRYVGEVNSAHNGTDSADATRVDYNTYGILQLGTAIPGLSITVELDGTGANQTVQLKVGASSNVDVITRRMSFGEEVGPGIPLDLTTVPHDISSTLLGGATADEPVLFFAPSRSFSIPTNFVNAIAIAETAGVGATVFTVQKLPSPYTTPTNIGTLTFGAGSKTGVFSSSPATTLQSGDVLRILAPSSPDTNLKNICITIQANYI
jgi:hypothetical protein